MTGEKLPEITAQMLRRLSYREREIIKLRYGLGDGYTYTLEEVGHIFKVMVVVHEVCLLRLPGYLG